MFHLPHIKITESWAKTIGVDSVYLIYAISIKIFHNWVTGTPLLKKNISQIKVGKTK